VIGFGTKERRLDVLAPSDVLKMLAKWGRREKSGQLSQDAADPKALIADCDYLPEDKNLRTVRRVLGHSAHILVRNPRQLPGRLMGCLPVSWSPDVDALRGQISGQKSFPWIRRLLPALSTL
jgi:hypothetical protein